MNQSPHQIDDTGNNSDLDRRILSAVAVSRWKSRVLSGFVLAGGLLSIAASLAVVAAYFIAYLPKERQIRADYETLRQADATLATSAVGPGGEEAFRTRMAVLDIVFGNTIAIAFCVMLVAAAVALLAIGTLVTHLIVFWHRRVTLGQVSASLERISGQLRILQLAGRVPIPPGELNRRPGSGVSGDPANSGGVSDPPP